jgi:hypothetical protein
MSAIYLYINFKKDFFWWLYIFHLFQDEHVQYIFILAIQIGLR